MAEDMDKAIAMLRRAYEAFNDGDFDTAVESLHPEIEWNRLAAGEGTLHGRDAVREFMNPDIFESQHAEIHEISIHGDRLLVDGAFSGVARSSGIELRQGSYQLWTIRDGLAAKLDIFTTREEARAAAEADG